MPVYPARIIEGASPIIVAEPCRLAESVRPIRNGVGSTPRCSAIAKATGATMRIVATLSTHAEMNPPRRQTRTMAMPVCADRETMPRARSRGTPELANMCATTYVPAKVPRTFRLMADSAERTGMKPRATKASANAQTTGAFHFLPTQRYT